MTDTTTAAALQQFRDACLRVSCTREWWGKALLSATADAALKAGATKEQIAAILEEYFPTDDVDAHPDDG